MDGAAGMNVEKMSESRSIGDLFLEANPNVCTTYMYKHILYIFQTPESSKRALNIDTVEIRYNEPSSSPMKFYLSRLFHGGKSICNLALI